MLAALVIAVALGGVESSLPAPEVSTLAGLAREACVETGMQREAFERVARAHGWTSAGASRPSSDHGWNVSYRTGRAVLMLANVPMDGDPDPSLASICTISTDNPQGDWLSDLAALASELGMTAEPDPPSFGGAQMHGWSKFGSQTLTSAYQPANHRVAVTLSRQIVSYQ